MLREREREREKEREREREYVHQEGAAADPVETVLKMSFHFFHFFLHFRESLWSLRYKHVQLICLCPVIRLLQLNPCSWIF